MIGWLRRLLGSTRPVPRLASWMVAGSPKLFRCWCGAPSAADEPVLCHSCRDRQEGKAATAKSGRVVTMPRRARG